MQITVKTGWGPLTLHVQPSDTLNDVNKKLDDVQLLQPHTARLMKFADKHLLDGARTLADYDIKPHSVLKQELILPDKKKLSSTSSSSGSQSNIDIFVKGWDDWIKLHVNSSYTIQHLKAILEETLEFPADQQHLVFEDNYLKHGTLSDYNIQHGSTLHWAREI